MISDELLLTFDLSFSDSYDHLKNKVDWALILERLCTSLANIKKSDESHYLRIRAN